MPTRPPLVAATPGIPRILSDLADGQFTATEADAVAAWLKAAALESAPARIVDRAVRIAGRGPAERSPSPARRRGLAVPAYDSRLRSCAVGARSVNSEPPRLLYEAGLVEIDLEVEERPTAGRMRLLGHVTVAGSDPVHASVTVTGPSGHWEAPLDEFGQFSLDGLVPGVHRMEIKLATEWIEISELRL